MLYRADCQLKHGKAISSDTQVDILFKKNINKNINSFPASFRLIELFDQLTSSHAAVTLLIMNCGAVLDAAGA